MFLAPDEIQFLTGCKRKSAQRSILRGKGIQFMERPDGFPLVLRSHIEKRLGGVENRSAREPVWGPID